MRRAARRTVSFRTIERKPEVGGGSLAAVSAMVHSGWMQLTHWLGVALAAPAAAIVLFASWRTLGQRRPLQPEAEENP